MNPIDFLFGLFANHLQFEQQDHDAMRQKLLEYWENSTGAVKKFFTSPIGVIIVSFALPMLLPILRKALDNALNRLIGDQDQDGEVDVADALLAIVEKLKTNQGNAR